MGRKLREPLAPETPNDPEIRAEKKKTKDPSFKEENHHSPKRKLQESEDQDYSDSKEREKKKKKKKHKKGDENEKQSEEKEEEPKRAVVNGGGGGGGAEEDGSVKEGLVVVTGKDVEEAKYAPLKSFKESKLPSEVLRCCQNFESPSLIQARSWPFLLDGRDFIGIAATGSGKTLAFGVPAIMHILTKRKGKFSKGRNPLCLVLSPTRELAQQISDVLCEAGKPCGVISVCLYGGTSKGPQISSLKSGVDIVIGTPGRLKDLIEMGVCCLKEKFATYWVRRVQACQEDRVVNSCEGLEGIG
ncbi:DNA helicase, ATP-dependent [Trema orientale]|uniref:DNA helicase, ATP-dependent n=1 Tax=Trema orientale TaxID=63057 RepID=A0A2P5FAB9_TREOI|nr:DNA helicase, ATP-dependent [Trema orientale]